MKTITNRFRKNELAGPEWKQNSFIDVSDGENRVRCCKEKYFIGTCDVKFMNQGKLDVAKRQISLVRFL